MITVTGLGTYANELRAATIGWCTGVILGKELEARQRQLKMIYGRS